MQERFFSDEQVKELLEGYSQIEEDYKKILFSYANRNFNNTQASEFASHGFMRRMGTIKRCIDNVYNIYSPDRHEKLSEESISDLIINLQSLILNVYGCLDNLAWVWVKEKNINKNGKALRNGEIGFAPKYKIIRKSFSTEFQLYLNNKQKWFKNLENFRHALAHRIPLYVPPYVSTPDEIDMEKDLTDKKYKAMLKDKNFNEYTRLSEEIDKIGKPIPVMTHSFSEGALNMVFHAQVLSNWNTIIEISEKFLKELDK